jgi:TolA-binding protein
MIQKAAFIFCSLYFMTCSIVMANSAQEAMMNLQGLESEFRQLTGQIEKLTHQMLQIQSQIESFNVRLNRLEQGFDGSYTSKKPSDQSKASLTQVERFKKTNQLQEMARELALWVEQNPKDSRIPKAFYDLGLYYFDQKDYAQSAVFFGKLYKQFPKDPKSPDALLRLAKAFKKLNKPKEACSALIEIDRLSKLSMEFKKEVAQTKKAFSC